MNQSKTKRPYKQEIKDKARQMAASGSNFSEIARSLGIALQTITRWLHTEGVQNPFRPGLVGLQGEELVAEKLRSLGLSVELTPHKESFDLLCNGSVRVEVKTAAHYLVTTYQNGNQNHAANFHTAGTRSVTKKGRKYSYKKNYGDDCDFAVFVWLGDEKHPRRFWVVDSQNVPVNTRITLDPVKRPRVWGARENRFDLIVSAAQGDPK